jgi:N-acetylmuramoyl-L-alanine amidase
MIPGFTSELAATAPIRHPAHSPRKATDYIVLHCTATPEGREEHAKDIDKMHRVRGFVTIGYHYIVCLDGTIEAGRPEDVIGAHVEGHNSNSIGISYVGGVDAQLKAKDTRTDPQKAATVALISDILTRHPNAKVLGHRDFPAVKKDCPCFNAIPWAASMKLPGGKYVA